MTLTKAKDTLTKKVANETVVLHIKSGNYYSLNEVGSRFWELCDGKTDIKAIRKSLSHEFSTPEKRLDKDLSPFIDQMLDSGLLISG